MMPKASDLIIVILKSLNCFFKMSAEINPEVPPPRITMDLNFFESHLLILNEVFYQIYLILLL
jgi:hypothetical protein